METNLKRITAEVRSSAISKLEWVENGYGSGSVYAVYHSSPEVTYLWTGVLETDFLAILLSPSIGRTFQREVAWRNGIIVHEYEMAS